MSTANVSGDLDSATGLYGLEDDSEEFCSECLAGMESSEHHEKCVRPLDDEPNELPLCPTCEGSAWDCQTCDGGGVVFPWQL